MPPTDHSFNNKYTRLVVQPVLALLLFVIFSSAALAAQPDSNSVLFAVFKPLSNIPQNKRVAMATGIYKDKYRHLSEPVIMAVLDSLQLLAQNLDDQPLECNVYLLRADYYSVNRGFNALSISYHQKAIDYAVANHLALETAISLHKKGLYYFTFNHNIDACQYFLQAMDKFKQIGFSHVPDISTYILEQGKFYYVLRDYATAKPLLDMVMHHPINNIRIQLNVINTIGLIYRSDKQYPQALNYFNQALKKAIDKKDSAWVGITLGNIGSVYFMQGLYDKAMPYLITDYKTSAKFSQFANAALTLTRISHINLQRNQLKLAAMQLDTIEMLIHKSAGEDVLGVWIEVYNQRAILCQRTGKLNDAIVYAKKFEASKDSLTQRNSIAAIERVKLKWESEKYDNQIDQLKTRAETDAFKRNAVIAILFLLIIIFVLLFNRFRLDAKKDQEMLLIRKRRVDEKLKSAAESLQLYTENLKQNNTLIEKFKAEIERFKVQSTDRAGAEHLEKLMQAHIMTDDSWTEFKKLFTKVHGGFFSKLRGSFPYLTDTDMRLLALIKLGLNNREMANMLGITIEGIKKSKQRLRKKMRLSPDTDIEQIVAGL
ncbi:MAG: tetratricopeptide repeat protein [Bacteroidota bacterium]